MHARDHSAARVPWLPALLGAMLLLSGCGRQAPTTPSAPATGTDAESSVNFANFIEEIAPDTLANFTRETGIRVNYDTYELNQVLEARLLVGNTGLDLVVPGNNFLERQVQAGVYQKLDRSLLPILRHLDPALLEQVARITEHTGFANANIAGTALLPAELREDPMVYPDAATMHRLQVATVHTDEYSRLQNREFMRFRTGQ
jgi:spermidine/putrescine-binding protein